MTATLAQLVGMTPAGAAIVLTQFFDGVAAPALPAGWSMTTNSGPGWATTSTTPHSAPNAAFAPASGGYGDAYLLSPVFTAPVNGAVTFRHKYDMRLEKDGGVLEMKIGNGAFFDVAAAGAGYFAEGGYNGQINPSGDTFFQGTLNGRTAWTGTSAGYVTTRAILPTQSFGQTVQLRWRLGTDNQSSATSIGWWVDSIEVADDPTAAVTINQAAGQADPATTGPINFVAQFGRSVADFDGSDVSFVFSTPNTGLSAQVSGGPQTYNVAVSGMQPGQIVRASIPPGRVQGGNVASTSTDNSVTFNGVSPATLSISNVTVVEGNAGPTPVNFTITRSGDKSGTSTVTWATKNNSALDSSGDYVAVPATTVTFAPGDTTKTVSVTVNGDTTFEADENFYVLLSAPTGATITTGTALGFITNDDAGLSVSDAVVAEGNSATTVATFTITRSGVITGASSVQWATADNSAKAGTDYVAVPATTVNFAAGEPTKTVSVTINGDAGVESTETFFVNLTNPTGASIVDGTGVGTITTDDTGLAVNNVTVAEGNSGPTAATFTITRTGVTTGASSVQWSTANGSAAAGSDYVAVPATTASFAAGETTKAVVVTVNGDTTFEGNETFTVNLANPTGATILDNQGVGTITNDETGLAINDVSMNETTTGQAAARFTITRTGNVSGASSVVWSTADNTAKTTISIPDYVAVPPTTIHFAAGETTKDVYVSVIGDTYVEITETFFVKLTNPTGATIVDGTGVGTLINDDTGFVINDVAVVEGNSGTTAATFTVTRTGVTNRAVAVDWATANSSATDASDFLRVVATRLSFAAGETTKTVSVSVYGDTAVEGNEVFAVKLTNPANATVVDGTGVGTITNDDTGLSVNDVSVTEGASGTTAATFTITRNGITTGASSVQWSTLNGTATAGSDYVAVPATTVSFAAGETTKTVAVTVNGDTTFEPNETFLVKLTNPIGAAIADNTGVGTITTDETGLSVNDVVLTEGNSGTTAATFTITRSGITTGVSTVDWATANVNAAAGSDYVAVPATTVRFAAGEVTTTVSVTVNGDTLYESSERFNVVLTNATGATIADGIGIGQIMDDDTGLRINDVTITEGSTGTTLATFTITRSGVTTGASTVDWATANSTALSGSDYVAVPTTTVSFAAGETTQTVSVTINGDTTVEPAEKFNVNLTNPTGATIADSLGVGTILNDD